MKKHLLLFAMILLPLVVSADAVEINGIYYNLISKTKQAEVTRNPNKYTGSVVIPEKVTYENIEYSVTSIGSEAFYGSGLTSVTIPNSVTSIGDHAFYGCFVKKVIVKDIAAWCGIKFGDYDSNPLYHAKHIYSNEDTEIINLVIPNSVTSIGDRAFYGCSGLTSVTIPNSVTSIGDHAFIDCTGLTTVTIGNSVTSIGDGAFVRCSGLTSITIPNSVTSIGYYAFYGCSGLTTITIPNSVTSIGGSVFSECYGLKKVIVKDISAWCGIKFGEADSNPLFYAHHLYSDENTEITNLVIPNSVKSIGNYAFYGCSGLTSVTIGNSVASIGSRAFSNTNLKKTIWLTNTPPTGYNNASGAVNYVSNDQYSSLKNMIIYPFLSSIFEVDGVKYVPVSPSERTCDAIDCVYDSSAADTKISSTVSYKGVTMSVQKVQPYVCYGNTFIESLSCDNEGAIGNNAFDGCKNLKTLLLGNKITSIGNYAFQDCTSLQSLVVPNSVTELCSSSFSGCSSLINVTIGNQVNNIGSSSFSGCSSLINVTIGNQVNNIGSSSFSGCKSLSKISIPRSVKTISNYVFQGCTGLKEFIIEDRETELTLGNNGSTSPLFSDCPLDYVYIGGNISYGTSSSQGYSPFYRNTTLRKVVITDNETEISTNEFYGCTNLQEFTVGDGVTTFGDWAFSGCSSLKSLSFGTQLKTIGKEAFSDCTSVTKIVSKAQTPPTCSTQALDDINKWNCTLSVPAGTMSAYQAADQWKDFFFISEGDPTGIKAIENTQIKNTTIYNLNGVRLSEPKKGINIINGKKVVIK